MNLEKGVNYNMCLCLLPNNLDFSYNSIGGNGIFFLSKSYTFLSYFLNHPISDGHGKYRC